MRRRLRFSRSRRCLVFLAALLGQGLGLGCSELPGVVIVGPAHGTFSTASEIMVTGLVTSVEPASEFLDDMCRDKKVAT